MVQFRAADNSLITVRPLQPDDAPYLVEIFGHLSPLSRYRRFNQPLEQPDEELVWEEAERIAHSVATGSRGVLAFTDLPEIENTPIAGARYVISGPGEAELAVSVADEFQRLGIGTELVKIIVEEARAAGLSRLTGVVLNENVAVLRMLRHLPYPVERKSEGGVTYLTIHLDRLA